MIIELLLVLPIVSKNKISTRLCTSNVLFGAENLTVFPRGSGKEYDKIIFSRYDKCIVNISIIESYNHILYHSAISLGLNLRLIRLTVFLIRGSNKEYDKIDSLDMINVV